MTEEAQCGFEVRQAEMPCGRTREALKGGTVEPPRFAVVPLHTPGWIAVHFLWISILGTLGSNAWGAVKTHNNCNTRGSPGSLGQICVSSD